LKTLEESIRDLIYLPRGPRSSFDLPGRYAIGDGSVRVADEFTKEVLAIIDEHFPPPHLCPTCGKPK